MKLVDLHVHSNASDGTYAPADVVRLACEKELTAIALTDHDTVSGVDEALLAAENTDLELIPGIELSCNYEEKEIHILGLWPDHHDESLLSFLANTRRQRHERNLEMIERFGRDGFVFTLEDLEAGNPGTVITRAHFARVLIEKGYVSSVDQAFRKYLSPGCLYYKEKPKVTPEAAMDALQSAGAFPVIAHPCQYKMGWERTETMIAYLKELGLRGVECYHSSNNQDESGKLRRIATRLSLLPTGGSDFHGANKPDIQIGCGRGNLRVPALLLDDIKLAMFLGAHGA